jgi:uncharacterized membrane protein YedE/YeeE
VIEICLVAFGSVLLLGSIGAFFLYIPFLSIAAVVVILLGMVLAFLSGVWLGGTRILRLRRNKKRRRRSGLVQEATAPDPSTPVALILPSD